MADGLLNKASIILTPTGYKAGTLYNVAPIDEPYEDFDFARASVASRVNSSGLVSNVATGVPRISYDSNGDNGHILLEPTSTNLVTYSEDFTESYWTTTSLDVETSLVIAPDGSSYANKLVPDDGTGGFRGLSRIFNSLSGLHTVSFFAKKGEYDYLMLRTRNSPNTGVMFNLDDGTFTINLDTDMLVDNSIFMTALPNDWYRCELTLDPSEATNVGQLNLGWNVGITGNEQNSFSGDGVSGVYLWGVQFEALPYATSYIPTLTGSTETRATETATGAGSADLINSTEGVLYAEIAALADGGDTRTITISSAANNRITLSLHSTTNRVQFYIAMNGYVNTVDLDATDISQTNMNKIACKFKANDYALWINGVEKDTNTTQSNTVQSGTLNSLNFDINGSNNFYGKVKAVAVFNEALSDSELTQLTT